MVFLNTALALAAVYLLAAASDFVLIDQWSGRNKNNINETILVYIHFTRLRADWERGMAPMPVREWPLEHYYEGA
jgi:hypothetical protein